MKSIIISTFLLLFSYTNALSCNCKSPLLETEITLTQNIFLATVKSTQLITFRTEKGANHQLYKTTLVVQENYKGSQEGTVDVLSRTSDCSFAFDVDSTYIIFASKHPRYMKLFTSPCQRTALASQSAALIRKVAGVKNRINEINELAPEDLYQTIWGNELFKRVDETPRLQMSFEEAKAYVSQHLKPCEITFEPRDKRDSLIIESPSFEAASKRFTVLFEVDTSGHIINPCIESNWHESMPLKDDAITCKQNAVELVKHMPPMYPAEIKNIKVRTMDKFVVDFSLVMEP